MEDESIELTVTDEVEDVWLTNGHRFEDHYAEKVEGPIPEHDWEYTACKAEEEPCAPEPYTPPPRKQRDKTWKRKTRRHQSMARPPRIHQRQRR